jgi:hypothetical protein
LCDPFIEVLGTRAGFKVSVNRLSTRGKVKRTLTLILAVAVMATIPTVGQSPARAAVGTPDRVAFVDSDNWWHIPRPGQPDYTFRVMEQFINDRPIVLREWVFGDWDGDGFDTPGLVWHTVTPDQEWLSVMNSLPPDGGEIDFPDVENFLDLKTFWADGVGRPLYFFGDWDGDGDDDLGVYGPSRAVFGNVQLVGESRTDVFWFGGQGDDVPLAGDWDEDGIETMAVYRDRLGKVYFTNSVPSEGTPAPTDGEYWYGIGQDSALAGDWDGDGLDTVGVHRRVPGGSRTIYLRNSLTTGFADEVIAAGPVARGVWAGRFDIP